MFDANNEMDADTATPGNRELKLNRFKVPEGKNLKKFKMNLKEETQKHKYSGPKQRPYIAKYINNLKRRET